MIRPPAAATLDAAERHGLYLLLDLSRVAIAEPGAGACVEVRIADRPAPDLARSPAEAFRAFDGVLEIARAALQWATEIGGAAAEQRSTARDRHGRVPADENPLAAQALERRPVVSCCGRALRDAALRAAGERPFRLVEAWPDGRRWAAAFTHDLDAVVAWPVFTALRLLELARKREIGRVGRTLAAAVRAVGRDPLRRAALALLEAERRAGIRGTWFVLAGTPTFATRRAGDLTYEIESPPARRILDAVLADHNEVALHGSFATVEHGALFVEQRERLKQVVGQEVAGVRQHYLRMRPGTTQRAMADAGFRYDSTAGFPDRNGFRIGIADVAPAWDEGSAATLPIDEVPFVWMDRALSKYRGVERPDAWIEDALELAHACREVEGLWTGVWHPNLAPALGFPDAPAAYERLLREIRAASPWIGTMSEIVAWRTRRRKTRVRAVHADGRVQAVSDVRGAGRPVLRLETADGRAAEEVRSEP